MATCVVVPMGPACVNITGVRAGDRNQMNFALTSGGAPIDLTGKTLQAQARTKATDPDPPVLTAVVDVLDAVAGTGVLRWPGDQVYDALDPVKGTWSGFWDMQVVDDADPDNVVTVVEGTIAAVTDITRP